MGIYTSNRYFGEAYDYAAEIPANESYNAAFGCAHILADIQRNDMALFESAIYEDIKEVTAVHEGYGYVNENAFTDIIKKLIESFKKILAKIKGIFKNFLSKITITSKNNRDLVKEYAEKIKKCTNWNGFKVEGIRVPKSDDIKSTLGKTFSMKTSNKYAINKQATNQDDIIDSDLGNNLKTAPQISAAESNDIKLALIKKYIMSINIDDYDKISETILDGLYGKEEELTSITSSNYFEKKWIKSVLEDEDWTKEVQDINSQMEKVINTVINDLNKTHNDITSFIADPTNSTKKIDVSNFGGGFADGYDTKVDKDTNISSKNIEIKGHDTDGIDPKTLQAGIQSLQKLANNEQEIITKVTSEYMSNVKFAIAQARKIWTMAAKWAGSHKDEVKKESVEYLQALGDSEAEQVYTVMESL